VHVRARVGHILLKLLRDHQGHPSIQLGLLVMPSPIKRI